MTIEDPVSERIIGCSFKVHGVLGHGFLEKVYENALAYELHKAGLRVQQQAEISVVYDGQTVGTYFADLLVEARILVELKAVKALDDVHMAQCLNYMKATGLQTCLLLNFGKSKVEVRRLSMSRERIQGWCPVKCLMEPGQNNDFAFLLSPKIPIHPRQKGFSAGDTRGWTGMKNKMTKSEKQSQPWIHTMNADEKQSREKSMAAERSMRA